MTIHGENFTVDMNNPHAPMIKEQYCYPAIYTGGVPAVIEPVKRSWFKRKQTYSFKEFFQIEKNSMVVYKLVPHSDVTNNNKRLWRAIYKMYEMYESNSSRTEKRGIFKFRYREKDQFWFDVVFRQVNGQKKIEFYVSTTEFQAQKLKRKIENKMSVTMTEASIEDLYIPYENTIVQEMRYLKHDIFSLNTNSNETKTPIAGILSTVDELQYDGDVARMSICAEAENRNKWVKNAQWAYEKLSKGKVPHRANIDGHRIAAGARVGIAGVINEINDLLTDTFQAIANSFFKSEKQFSKEKVIKKGYSLQDEIGSTRFSHEKGNQPVFKVHYRVVAHSKDDLTRDSMSESLALSTQDLSEANELNGIKIKINSSRTKEILTELNTLTLSMKTKYDPNVNLVSTDELSKLALMIPNKELQRKFADALNAKKRVEVEIPAVLRDSNGIYLGNAELKDQVIQIYMPVSNPDEFFKGYVFIGVQGAGKDTAIINWVVEGNLKHGISFIIPDAIVEEGERGMADGIRDALPPENIIDLNLFDDDYTPALDLTEVVEALGSNGADRFAMEMIDFLQIEGLARSEKYLTEAAKASRGSLYNIKRIIEDDNFRAQRIRELIDEDQLRLARELLGWGPNEKEKDGEPYLGNKADPILNRLNRFFGTNKLFDIFAQDPIEGLNFAKWMKEGKVVIIRVPNGKGFGEFAVKILVHWITLKVFMTRLLMTKEEQKNGCFIVFNEPEQYESEGLTKLMGRIGTEGRKERLGSIYAFHHWNKLAASLQENLQGGGVQQFLFANDHTTTFDKSKHRFEETIPLEEAYKTPLHHAIISVRAGKELQPAFLCHMRPPVKQQYNNSYLTKRHAQMYGRSWKELQEII